MSVNGQEEESGAPSVDTLTLKDDPVVEESAIVVNGHESPIMEQSSSNEGQDGTDKQQLLDEIEQIKGEKEHLESQYRALLGKLTTMRNTLGDKLRQDADELDRRASEIAELRQANADLSYTSETLRSELIAANEESSALSEDLTEIRSRFSESNNNTEDVLRETQQEVEELRMQVELWENEADRERVQREELETSLDLLAREAQTVQLERDRLLQERDREKESAENLSTVLHDFQTSKEREIDNLTSDLRQELQSATRMMSEYKQRSLAAETKLSTIEDESDQTTNLKQEVKEKNLLIGKLRHEAVILNEHLTEALRRLRKDSSDNNVDRRLVTNVLLSFLTTPRADAKRFQMLQLLASVLTWSDDDREKAGLQRASASSTASTSSPKRAQDMSPSTSKKGHNRNRTGAKLTKEEDLLGENESFSNLFVEYLLKESAAGTPALSTATSPPPLPLFSPPASGIGSYFGSAKSTVSTAASNSSPTPSTRRPSVSSASVFSTGPSSVMDDGKRDAS